ncbi:MAG: DnaJ domain-containing protein [Candidatus Chromulinivorax sp.]
MKIILFILLMTIHSYMFSMDYKKACSILSIAQKQENESEEVFCKRCRKRYKKLALKYHPDKNTEKSEQERNESEESFKKVSSAYEFLINNENGFDHFTAKSKFQETSSDFQGASFGFQFTSRSKFQGASFGFQNKKEFTDADTDIDDIEDQQLKELFKRFGLEGKVKIMVKVSEVKIQAIAKEQSWSDWLYEKIGINSK